MDSALEKKRKIGFTHLLQKLSLLGVSELLIIATLLSSGLLVSFAAVKQLKEDNKLSIETKENNESGPGGSLAKISKAKKEKAEINVATEEAKKVNERVVAVSEIPEEKKIESNLSKAEELDREESVAIKEQSKTENNLTGADKKTETTAIGGAPIKENIEEEIKPPVFYEKELKKEIEEGPTLEKFGPPPSTKDPPANTVDFSVNPLPRRVTVSSLPIEGTKSLSTGVYINDELIIAANSNTYWSYILTLTPGNNKLAFSSKNVYGKTLSQFEYEINYEILEEGITQRASLNEGKLAEISESYYATPSAETILNPKTAPLLTKLTAAVKQSPESAESPRIYSPTHPNQNRWYRDQSPKIVWEENTFWLSYLISLSRRPTTPINNFGPQTRVSYENLDDGVWYFGVKAVTSDGTETSPNYYRLLIDRTPPKISNIRLADISPVYKNSSLVNVEVTWVENMLELPSDSKNTVKSMPYPFLEAATKELLNPFLEDLSPLRKYISVDFSKLDSNFQLSNLTVSSPEKIGPGSYKALISYLISKDNVRADEGGIPLIVKVSDFAGNEDSNQASVTLANNIPIKMDISTEAAARLIIRENIGPGGYRISGNTVPNVDLIITIYSDPFTATVRSDYAGNWEYIVREPLAEGNHVVYAQAKDRLGNSTPTVQIGALTVINKAQAAEINNLVETVGNISKQEKLTTGSESAKELTPIVNSENLSENVSQKIVSGQVLIILGLVLFLSGIISLIMFLQKKTP